LSNYFPEFVRIVTGREITTIFSLQQKFGGTRDFTPKVYFKRKKENSTEQQNSIEAFKNYPMHKDLHLCRPTVTVNTFKYLRLG